MESKRLGKYELQERLGKGGMGEVWKARDTDLQRYVAIKLLHADLQSNPDFVTHFKREAQFIASLHHPNIVQIHDFELTDRSGSSSKAYMVMDYVEGGTLADYIRSTSRKGLFPPAADIVYLFTAIGLALDYAHQKGMIHRDIKPANILLDKHNTTGKSFGEPILSDFGIAKLQKAGTATLTHAAIGTPLYISPEQAEGGTVDERSDLYSLGIILYEIVTGVTPFRGDNPLAIMMQHIHDMPTPPALINPAIAPDLSAVVLKSIAKGPDDRFPTASAMVVALAQALHIPTPASLNRSTFANEQSNYNPLQPATPLVDRTPSPGALPSSPNVLQTPPNVPQTFLPLQREPGLTPNVNISGLSQGNSPPALLNVPQTFPLARRRPRRLHIALLACVLLLLIGITGFAVFGQLLSKPVTPPNPAGSVVGHIVFVRSPHAFPNTFDQLSIDLAHIPPPPAGTNYYAWLQNTNSEIRAVPHWKLQVSNGSIHGLFSNASYPNLLTSGNLFLVTEEDVNSRLDIPDPNPSRHIYYARISSTSSSSPTFEVKQCPAGDSGNGTNPCI